MLGRPAGDRKLRDRVGYLTQAPSVYDDLTVAENLAYFARRCRRRAPAATTGGSCAGLADRPRRRPRRPALGRAALPGLPRGRARRHARAARARRADGGARPRAAARPLERVPAVRRRGHHAAGQQPRHGRGRPVRPPPAACARAGCSRTTPSRRPRRNGYRRRRAGLPRARRPRPGAARRPRSRCRRERPADARHRGRVLRQIRHDPRTLVLLVVVPCVLVGLLAWIYREHPASSTRSAPR